MLFWGFSNFYKKLRIYSNVKTRGQKSHNLAPSIIACATFETSVNFSCYTSTRAQQWFLLEGTAM
jgi:hypothetical protein